MKKIVIKENDANQRIDKYLKKLLKKLFNNSKIKINKRVFAPQNGITIGKVIDYENIL